MLRKCWSDLRLRVKRLRPDLQKEKKSEQVYAIAKECCILHSFFFCVQREEDGGCDPRDRCICLQLCTRIRNFCTFVCDNQARVYNFGATLCKYDALASNMVLNYPKSSKLVSKAKKKKTKMSLNASPPFLCQLTNTTRTKEPIVILLIGAKNPHLICFNHFSQVLLLDFF